MKTIKKALDILEVFLSGKKEIGISELANLTGQNISTIHSILHELAERGYIRQRQERGKYSLGFKFLSFTDNINELMSIEETFHPYMVELCNAINETVNVAIKNGNYVVNLAIIHSTHKLNVIDNEKIGAPLYCTGNGKIFLAGMSDGELDKYLSGEKLISYTTRTITDTQTIKRQIQKIRREDVAQDNEEYQLGVRNIAAPVRDHSGKIVAAIAVLAPSVRLPRNKIKEIIPLLKKCAGKISGEMGYKIKI